MRLISVFTLCALLIAAVSAGPLQTIVLDVQNMTCQLCPLTVRKALQKVPGVAEVSVDFAHKTATVAFDPDKADTSALVKATTNAGYPSTLHP
ncbi:MAG: mercury resistance system periplasmic binding protein MerP [Methylococcaceae bacterium]|nr:MAG: mercury resistance system periplasmic binding protein MerP [Methylococcaceae bacterium]